MYGVDFFSLPMVAVQSEKKGKMKKKKTIRYYRTDDSVEWWKIAEWIEKKKLKCWAKIDERMQWLKHEFPRKPINCVLLKITSVHILHRWFFSLKINSLKARTICASSPQNIDQSGHESNKRRIFWKVSEKTQTRAQCAIFSPFNLSENQIIFIFITWNPINFYLPLKLYGM